MSNIGVGQSMASWMKQNFIFFMVVVVTSLTIFYYTLIAFNVDEDKALSYCTAIMTALTGFLSLLAVYCSIPDVHNQEALLNASKSFSGQKSDALLGISSAQEHMVSRLFDNLQSNNEKVKNITQNAINSALDAVNTPENLARIKNVAETLKAGFMPWILGGGGKS